MGPKPKGNEIHVYGGAAETVPCPYGEPFPDLPTSFILAAPTLGENDDHREPPPEVLQGHVRPHLVLLSQHQAGPLIRTAQEVLGEDERPGQGAVDV